MSQPAVIKRVAQVADDFREAAPRHGFNEWGEPCEDPVRRAEDFDRLTLDSDRLELKAGVTPRGS
jgi:hypothetical protein